ncbi:MAG: hypothetical protein KAT70_07645 [Thermoplasmata archaeon]|nr:hypothetical protein [Thermoplasmata archaeon]
MNRQKKGARVKKAAKENPEIDMGKDRKVIAVMKVEIREDLSVICKNVPNDPKVGLFVCNNITASLMQHYFKILGGKKEEKRILTPPPGLTVPFHPPL